jgi:lipid A disaccharide synthetase
VPIYRRRSERSNYIGRPIMGEEAIKASRERANLRAKK